MIKWILLVLLFSAILVFLWASWHFATQHAGAMPSEVGPPPPDFPVPIQPISFQSLDGISLEGWLAIPDGSTSGIILLHQYGANRLSMLNRARLFCQEGYAVFLYDARGHGESSGDEVSVGYYEVNGLLAAVQVMEQHGINTLSCVGWSQGGATILMAASELPPLACVVLESSFDTFHRAIDRGFRKYTRLPSWVVGWAYQYITEKKLRFQAHEFRPIDNIGALNCPVYIISGTKDASTWVSDTREIFEAAKEPKTLWLVKGARHEDLYEFAPRDYEDKVLPFIKRYMPIGD